MLQFKLESRFPQTPDALITRLLDGEYQAGMHTELGFPTWVEESREDQGNEMRRSLRIVPPSKLPGFLQKMAANKTGYRESQIWAADRRSYTWSVVFDLSKKLSLTGTCTFVPDGQGTKRTVEFTAEMNARLMAKRIEAVVRDEALKTQRATAEYMARD